MLVLLRSHQLSFFSPSTHPRLTVFVPNLNNARNITSRQMKILRFHKNMHLDAKNMALTFGFVHYEISVALNHDVDDLLVGLIAEIKESINPQRELANIENQQVFIHLQLTIPLVIM